MAKGGRVIKLSVNMKPFVSRVVRDGKAQKKFKAMVAPINACVRSNVKKGMSGADIKNAVKRCAKK